MVATSPSCNVRSKRGGGADLHFLVERVGSDPGRLVVWATGCPYETKLLFSVVNSPRPAKSLDRSILRDVFEDYAQRIPISARLHHQCQRHLTLHEATYKAEALYLFVGTSRREGVHDINRKIRRCSMCKLRMPM